MLWVIIKSVQNAYRAVINPPTGNQDSSRSYRAQLLNMIQVKRWVSCLIWRHRVTSIQDLQIPPVMLLLQRSAIWRAAQLPCFFPRGWRQISLPHSTFAKRADTLFLLPLFTAAHIIFLRLQWRKWEWKWLLLIPIARWMNLTLLFGRTPSLFLAKRSPIPH